MWYDMTWPVSTCVYTYTYTTRKTIQNVSYVYMYIHIYIIEYIYVWLYDVQKNNLKTNAITKKSFEYTPLYHRSHVHKLAMCTYGYVGPWPSSMPAASQSDKFLVLGWVGYKWRMGYQRDPLVFSSSLYWTLLNYASSCCEYFWITHYQWSATMMLDQHELECTSQYWLDGWVWKTSQPLVRHLGNMWARLVYHVLILIAIYHHLKFVSSRQWPFTKQPTREKDICGKKSQTK